MRSYTVAIASLAIGAPQKWTDNLISLHAVLGIRSAKRGVARRISHPALIRLAIVRQLHTELRLGVADALKFADQLLDSSDSPNVFTCGHIRVSLDRLGIERTLEKCLRDALESAPAPRRGRPPRRPTT